MGDVPTLPQTEPEPTVQEQALEWAKSFYKGAEAAVPGVPMRRATLFLIIGLALVLYLPAAGIAALLVLALTDQVV